MLYELLYDILYDSMRNPYSGSRSLFWVKSLFQSPFEFVISEIERKLRYIEIN